MDFQTGFNAVLGILGALVGWMLNTLYNSMKDLTRADQMLSDKVQSIEVLVAGNYVKKSELEHILHKLDTKLDRIEDKIDHTQDRRARYSVPE